jgi:hypothetical protein
MKHGGSRRNAGRKNKDPASIRDKRQVVNLNAHELDLVIRAAAIVGDKIPTFIRKVLLTICRFIIANDLAMKEAAKAINGLASVARQLNKAKGRK